MTKKKIPFLGKNETTHHILPRSRGGSDDEGNTQTLPDKKHKNWHICFGNDAPEEVVAKMLLAWNIVNPFHESPNWLFPIREDRISKRRMAWKSLFDNADREECIEIVAREFGKGREFPIQEMIRSYYKNRA